MPLPNEHSARLRDPSEFDSDTFRRTEGGTIFGKIKCPETIGIIWGKLKGKSKPSDFPVPQALRFPTKNWTADEAKDWLKEHGIKYIRFEPAKANDEEKESEIIPKAAFTFREEELGIQLTATRESETAKRRFSMLAHSGKIMENHWFWGNFAIDLAGVQIGRQKKPALREHDTNRIVGWTEKIAKEDGIRVEGFFCETTEDGKEALLLADEGFPWQASVYIPPLDIEKVAEGEEVEVNGYKLKGPGTVFRKSRLREVSFCALGADEHTDAEALTDACLGHSIWKKEGKNMEITVEQLKNERQDIVEVLTAEGKTAGIAEGKAAGLKEGAEQGRQSEKDRMVAIFDATPKGLESVAISAVREGLSVEAAKDKFLKELKNAAPASPGPAQDPQSGEENLSVEEKAKKEWEKSQEIRDEFRHEKTYLAFKKAEDMGRAKISKK
ncbi:MAG: hypothetical protein HY350_04780 [Candidatus Omnitrophica bacterium]|nr:hypothetical protein [Candidatus Omnitrophota bacterium]